MQTRLLLTAISLLSLLSCQQKIAGSSKTANSNAEADTMVYGPMKKYWMVFLKKGTQTNHDKATAARIQAAHLANIERLAKEKRIIMAGPMGYTSGDHELRGIFIINAKDSATAASYIATDSAIITGRLRFELHPWWTATGRYRFE